MDCGNIISSTTTQDLNDDCLIHIFSMLPIIDQIRLQRVCKRWRLLSQIALNGLKKFNVWSKKFWGITEKSEIKINHDIFKLVLNLYGRNITHIDVTYNFRNLENTSINFAQPHLDKNINMLPEKKVFQHILEFCPNVTSLHVGQRCEPELLQYIAENFRNLIHFTYMIESFGNTDFGPCNELSTLFSNNRNLKSLTINKPRVPLTCFSHLNSESIQEIHLRGIHHLELEPKVFWYLKKIYTLSVECFVDRRSDIVEMLRTIASHLQNLRKLELHFYFNRNYYKDSDIFLKEYDFLITLTDLEELHIGEETLANDKFIEIVCNNFKKLKTLKIENSNEITDEGMSKIELLPNLQNLYIIRTGLTGSFLSRIPKLKNLVVESCWAVHSEEIIILLLSSQYIENLEITYCPAMNGKDLIDTIIRNIKDRKFKKVQIKIRGEYDFHSDGGVQILEISGEYYTYASRRFCSVCRSRTACCLEPHEPCKDCQTTTFIQKISKN